MMVERVPSKLRSLRVVAAIILGLFGTLIFLFLSLSALRRENAFLRERLAASAEFQGEDAELRAEPNLVRQQDSPAEPPTTEILRLRGQVGGLREQLREAEKEAKELSRRLQVANEGATQRLELLQERTLAARTGPWIGVHIGNATNFAVETTVERSRPGVLVAGINPNSPASRSLLRAGDLVQRVGGRDVIETRQFIQILSEMAINQPLVLDVLRGNEAMSVEVTPTEWPR